MFATLLLTGLVALAWTQSLDDNVLDNTGETLQRALATFAVARAMNGAISVAQGTELAIQPVGVGVTLTVGEVLDPLNDLVERFSWLALLACVALGNQLLLSEVVMTPWLNALMSAAVAGYLLALWLPVTAVVRGTLLRAVTLLVFGRYLFIGVTLLTGWVDQTVLAGRQQQSLEQVQLAQEQVEALRNASESVTEPPPSTLDRFGAFFDDQRQALNVRARLDALTERLESAIAALINLFVIFTVQTILVPLAGLLLGYRGFLWLWRWSWQDNRRR